MSLTIRDVARAAGVSTATVSRALVPGTSPVAEKTRARVYSAAERLGYRANHAARSLKTRSTKTVAVIAPELANDFFMALAEGIACELDARGYTLLLATSENSQEEEKKRLFMLAERMADGFIVIPAGAGGDHLENLSGRGIPLVLIDRLVEGTDFDAVVSDNEGGARALTRALLSDGFRRIAFVGGDPAISSARERFSGYLEALAEEGIRPEPDWVLSGGMGVDDGYRRMGALLAGKNPPEALVAVNLLVHLGMERRLLECRGGTEKEASYVPVIAGFDESRYTPFLPACRYTAAQDAFGMGREAGRRILEKIHRKREREKFPQSAHDTEERAAGCVIRMPVTIIHHKNFGGNYG
ncbi:MAG: LacI family transcriptional regulator [Treponema sp.]|nr:LacI family transcriptional regulator [Treponema sp.]